MYQPDYVGEIETPDDLILAIRNTLEYWLMLHTDAETWTNQWTQDEDDYIIRDLMNRGVSNSYFSFDVKQETINLYVQDNLYLFYQCPECGMICESGYEECECPDMDYDTWEHPDFDTLYEWISDIEIGEDYLTRYVIQALENKGFETYRDAISCYTCTIEEECQTAIDNIDNAETNEDKLAAAMNAAGIYHVNGEIMRDYGETIGLDYDQLCTLRSDGLKALFDRETILEWLSQE